MGGHRGHLDSKPAREIFLTSSSLSFSSVSSSCASSNEEQKRKHSEASSGGSQKSDVTHVRIQPAPSTPSRLRAMKPVNNGLGGYDRDRIPTSVLGKTTRDLNWSEISNESLFSLRMSNFQAFGQSNIKPEDVLTPGGLVRFDKDAEEKRSEAKETKSGVTISVGTSSHGEKLSSLTPRAVLLNTSPSSFYELYQARPTKAQSLSTSGGEKKSKKTRKSKKKKKEKKEKKEKKKKEKKEKEKKQKFTLLPFLKNKCCIWSWMCSGIPKCECYKWRKCCCCCCCRGSKAMDL